MKFRTLAALVATLLPGGAHAQSPSSARTPWHVSTTLEVTNENPPGHGTGAGAGFRPVPNGYTAVVEHVSARCVAPPALSIVYVEMTVRANPIDPGQSGKPGPAGVEDSAIHPLLLQTAYSGSSNVYVASQSLTARLNSPAWLSFIAFVTKASSEALTASCQISISGYMKKQ
jgi:hypothetical protein